MQAEAELTEAESCIVHCVVYFLCQGTSLHSYRLLDRINLRAGIQREIKNKAFSTYRRPQAMSTSFGDKRYSIFRRIFDLSTN
jgi:hypothetical protein